MSSAFWRSGLSVLATLLLQSCGGGGGDDGGGGGGGPRVSLSTHSVALATRPGEHAPQQSVTMTLSNIPDSGLVVQGAFSTLGIETVDFVQTSQAQAELTIRFKLPGLLIDDTYEDTVDIRVCRDDACNRQVDGSPARITTAYTIADGISATLDRTSIEFSRDSRDEQWRTELVEMKLGRQSPTGIHIDLQTTNNAVSGVNWSDTTQPEIGFTVVYHTGAELNTGDYSDIVTIRACYEPTCARQLEGSPYTISSRVRVSAGAEPGIDALEVLSRTSLSHDVVDAEYSKTLDAIVMVGSHPGSALYVYDVGTGTETRQSLVKPPTAVSVGPDGLTAAVGHDALISIVDLTQVGQTGAPAPKVLDVSADVFDLVLDGRGSVNAMPRVDQWVHMHTVDIAANTEDLANGTLFQQARGRLHPSGDYIYTIDTNLSPSDLEKWDLTGDPVKVMYDSPYHGDYEMCRNLWFHENGATIYTACGNTFRSSVVQADDMTYAGAMQLSGDGSDPWIIRSLSQSSASDEIALIESLWYECEIPHSTGQCYTHFAVYEGSLLQRQSVHTLGPIEIGDLAYAQLGLFVFHNAAGDRKFVISKLEAMPDPDLEYYLSVVD
jgi:hypothetical protein